jgi:sugar-specific transcriptional regulator TrmB
MSELHNDLLRAGLSKPEIAVYLYLLEAGVSSPSEIAKGTGLQRPNTYNVLRSLSNRALIDPVARGRRRVYVAKDPSALVKNMEQRTEAIAQALPDLRALYKGQKNKPVIKYFEGAKEMVQLLTTIYPTEQILFISHVNYLFSEYADDFHRFRVRQKKQGTFVRQVLAEDVAEAVSSILKNDFGVQYDYRILDSRYAAVPSFIRIWDDNVFIANLSEPEFATMFTDKIIAANFKMMFETMWRASRRG